MGMERPFSKELLVVGMLSTPESPLLEVKKKLEERFGALWLDTQPERFTWTNYYDAEMGESIWRSYLIFTDAVDPSDLADIKRFTNELERTYSGEGARCVNLDPGLLAPGRFCLATTKDRAHRIPLSQGIFCELTLIYERGEFRPLPWTYPDWASQPVRSLLAEHRKRLFPAK